MNSHKLLVFLFVIMIGLTSMVVWLTRGTAIPARNEVQQKTGPGITEGQALIGGPFRLLDPQGQEVTDADFRGRLMLVFFGFTHCPDICPMGVLTLSRVMDALGGDAGQVAPIFITLDPERDTPEVMRSYVASFPGEIVALTGTREAIDAVASAYRVYHARVETGAPGEYSVDHSGFIYLMDREGHYLKHFSHEANSQDIVDAVRAQLPAR